jgi:amino acid adenylation domain-containing protein
MPRCTAAKQTTREDNVQNTVSREKRQALLDQMLRSRVGGRRPMLTPIPRRDPAHPVPLSFSQERLWFLDQLALGSQFYVESSAIRLLVAITPELLERAINAVVKRHEVLRARFDMLGDQPIQVAEPSLHLPLLFTDLSALPPSEQDQEVERSAVECAMQAFNLRQAPLLRTELLKLGQASYVFLLTIHHIISDGWSMSIFSREVSEYYRSFAGGKKFDLPELPIQYFDYAVWQRKTLQDEEVLDAEVGYWREQLRDLPTMELPLDHPRPRVLSYIGSHLDVRVPANLSAGLRALCRREQVTLFMSTLALFAAVLSLHSSQMDLAIGTPVAGRDRLEVEPLIGVFLNTVVLRLDLSGDPSYRELLRRVKDTALAAYEHQGVPFERLVAKLQPERDLGKNPLFQVLFQFFTPPSEKAGAASAQPSTVAVDRGTAILDLAYHLWDTPEGIQGRIEFSTELFEAHTIDQQFRHFLRLLAEVIRRPDRPLSAQNVITQEEQGRLLGDWQGPIRFYSQQRCLQQVFEERVAQTPDAIAVVEGCCQTTLTDLDRRTNQLAHHMIQLGVSRGSRVAICLDRSVNMIAAALAVIKAGGAYVPLDPAYPEARLRYIFKDSQAMIVVSDRAHRGWVPPGNARVVCLDEDREAIARQNDESPRIGADPLDVAYIIYTSGSTGRSKGVAGLHGSTMNRFEWMWDEFPCDSADVACQRTSLSFVDSIWEMFGPLLAGVPLVVVPDDVARDTRALVDLLARHRVTRLLTVPSLLLTLLDTGIELRAALPQLQLWFTSGERLLVDVVRRFESTFPDRTLVNLYGSSEVAGDILYERISPSDGRDSVPIGRPIANSRAYVLDQTFRMVPPGVAGELYVAGPNLARGYFDQPGLTAERFLPDQFSLKPGDRMYATGDRARHLQDGRIEYLGRTDHQVKLRGYRIELEEVESALREHPKVLDAAVAVEDDGSGGRLVAYVVRDGDTPATDELRRFAGTLLPLHMVPGSVVWLDRLPLTPNGKLNRASLPLLSGAPSAGFVAPRTEAEQALGTIWANLLKIDRVGMRDNFFEIGGHSLLAIRLVSRIRDVLGIELSLRDVFLRPTASDLAGLIEARLLDDIERLSDEEARLRLSADTGNADEWRTRD